MAELLGGKCRGPARADRRRATRGLEPVLPDPLRQALQGHQRRGRVLLPRELPHVRRPGTKVTSFAAGRSRRAQATRSTSIARTTCASRASIERARPTRRGPHRSTSTRRSAGETRHDRRAERARRRSAASLVHVGRRGHRSRRPRRGARHDLRRREDRRVPAGRLLRHRPRPERRTRRCRWASPTASTPDLWCHWCMPFAKTAQITRQEPGRSAGAARRRASATVPYKWNDRSLHFHASGGRAATSRAGRSPTGRTWSARATAASSAARCTSVNPRPRLVGRGRREDLRGRRDVPQPLRHRHRGLLRLRLVLPRAVRARLPQPAALRRARQLRQHVREPVPHHRRHPVHQVSSSSTSRTGTRHRTRLKTTRAAVSYWYARPGGNGLLQADHARRT